MSKVNKVPLTKTVNSDKFRGPAIKFEEDGFYCSAPPGTSEYLDYWTQEMEYCLEGYTAEDGDRIPGFFYFYLNYFPINLVKEKEVAAEDGTIKTVVSKERDFPRFYDYDRAFFTTVEMAQQQGKHLAVLKARRKGYSYKVASMLVRNYHFIRDSKGYALAAEAEYLTKDGILNKAWDGLDFIDEHTAWYKKRQFKNTTMHKRASYEINHEGTKIESGYKSDIIGVTLKNDPQKARGKAGQLIIFEEAGKFPNLLQAWQISRPSVEQGTNVFGTMIAFGTGGTEGADYEGLKELFERPDAYGCIAFENIWDENFIGQTCGFFIPQYANMQGKESDKESEYFGKKFMDKDGNTMLNPAKARILEERKKVIEGASDKRAIDRHIAELPITPAEATLNISSNIFPKKDLSLHRAKIHNDDRYREFKQVGDLLLNDDGTIKWAQSDKPKDITKYRLDPSDDPTGQVVIWEHPPADEIPWGMYIAGCDPYDHDKSNTNSLGSIFIYKREQGFEGYSRQIVAEYTGRPNTAEEFYETCRRLLLYFRATLLYENEKKGLFTYFRQKNCDYMLADQPDELIRDIINDSKVQRTKGIHMNSHIKDYMEIIVRDWLTENRGQEKYGLHTVLSEPLLEELEYYNDEGNFDRVIAFGLVLLYEVALHKVRVKQKKEAARQQLFEEPLFGDTSFQNFGLDF